MITLTLHLRNILLTLIYLALNSFTLARVPPTPTIEIERARVDGGDCKAESVISTISPGKKAISLIFQDYAIEMSDSRFAPNPSDEPRSHYKMCFLTVPIKIPPDSRARIERIDYRFFAKIPPGSLGEFKGFYVFATTPRAEVSETDPEDWEYSHSFDYGHRFSFEGPNNNVMAFTERPEGWAAGADGWQGCEDSATQPSAKFLQIDLMLKANSQNGPFVLALNSSDIDFGQEIFIKSQTCQEAHDRHKERGVKTGNEFAELFCREAPIPDFRVVMNSRMPNRFEELAAETCRTTFAETVGDRCHTLIRPGFRRLVTQACRCFVPGSAAFYGETMSDPGDIDCLEGLN